jgi:hypothetical protein
MFTMSSSESSSTDDEVLDDFAVLLISAAAATNTSNMFHELSENQNCVDSTVGVRGYLFASRATPYLFRTVMNFTASEFAEFAIYGDRKMRIVGRGW